MEEETTETETSVATIVKGWGISLVTVEALRREETRDRQLVEGKGQTLGIVKDAGHHLAGEIAEIGIAAHQGRVDHR